MTLHAFQYCRSDGALVSSTAAVLLPHFNLSVEREARGHSSLLSPPPTGCSIYTRLPRAALETGSPHTRTCDG